jgi:hypothetical protein
VNNPGPNSWNLTKTKTTISANGLEAVNNKDEWLNVFAVKGFPICVEHSREDNFPGTIVYYFEVMEMKSAFFG